MNSGPQVKSDSRRSLPAVDRLLGALRDRTRLPAWAAKEGCRRALAEARERLGRATSQPEAAQPERDLIERLLARAEALASELARPHPQRVVNATGIPLHTNLGRAPLAPGAAAAAASAGEHYGDLELDLASGTRGDRLGAVAAKLRLLSGAPAAFAVNNTAAAVLLALDTLARGKEVIVSRGELVEIGGSFRVPEIIQWAGVRLVEVGTTNRTRASDYERAIGPETGLILKVHRSNFEVRGFVEEAELAELAALGRARGLPVVEDLGSGTLLDLSGRGLPVESHAPSRLRAGADIVCFSGDKLLGGPQAGILLGTDPERVNAMRRNPLARALRLDKLSLAALDWTLSAHLDGSAEAEIPILRQLLAPAESLEGRAQALARRLAEVAGSAARIEVQRERSFAGGGSLPGYEIDGWVVVVRPRAGAEACAERLREARPPVLARIQRDAVLIDVRTLLDGDEAAIESALAAALR